MTHHFDEIIERRGTDSFKWQHYGRDVLPLWVADMDFRSPEPVVRALRERAEHGVFGYAMAPDELREVLVARLARLYGWQVPPEALVFLPGVVMGTNLAAHAVGGPGDGVLIQTPVYPPFLSIAPNTGRTPQSMELTRGENGDYTIDYAAFDAAFTDRTRLFVLCNPHNPVGRVLRRDELECLAEICLRHDTVICSDEIHCDLLFQGQQHLPIAALAPEIGDRTITLMAPSKTFNVAGLVCSFAVVTNRALRKRFQAAHAGLVSLVNLMGYTAALAAYRDGQTWLDELLAYLEGNRDLLYEYVNTQLPGVRMSKPEGTYLAWLDCRGAGIQDNPYAFFLKEACVALNDGATFGAGGEGFVRLNFGCPRAVLAEALECMRAALARNDAPRA